MFLLAILFFAFWPVWRWCIARMSDGSDEPMGLLALAAAAYFFPRRGWRDFLCVSRSTAGAALVAVPLDDSTSVDSRAASERRPHIQTRFLGALGLLAVYVAAFPFTPPLVRAIVAVSAIACVLPQDQDNTPRPSGTPLKRGIDPRNNRAEATNSSRSRLPLYALLLLSLPLIARLQYFLGFPARAATAWCAAKLLAFIGYAVEARGTVLQWAGKEILVDAPCSGVRMLWTAAFLSSLLGALNRLRPGRFLRLLQFAGAIVFVTNLARTLVLFFLETDLLPNPPWAHQAVGVAMFAAACAGCVIAANALRAGKSLAAGAPLAASRLASGTEWDGDERRPYKKSTAQPCHAKLAR